MRSPKLSLCFLVFLASYGISCCLSLGDVCRPKEHAALFVFGDSLFDVGNNNYINTTADYQANYSPYGETFFKYPTGRFSDGRVLPDFIAEYAKLPLIPPYLFPGNQRYVDGVNFASAGAGALVETQQGLVIDLKTQLSYFRKVSKELRQQLGNAETTALLAKAVYLINIGVNDYEISLSENSSNSHTAKKHVEMVVGNLTSVIKGIHEAGGRKFAVFNLPAVGCVPLVKGLVNGSKGSCVEEASALPKLHNSVLEMELGKLKKELEGFKYSYVDYFSISFDVINNPSKYGLKEGDVASCGSRKHRGNNSCGGRRAVKDYELCENPNQYVFFDSLHPTQATHHIVSQLVWSGNQKESRAEESRTEQSEKWHPDRCSGSRVEEGKKKFQAIQHAYSVLSDVNTRLLYDVGVYDSDDDQTGMGDFLNEMATMMSQSKPSENGEESFEDFQQLFEEMFQANIGSIGSTSHTNGEGSRSNKRNSTEIHFGKTDNTSELNTSNQNFCSGVVLSCNFPLKMRIQSKEACVLTLREVEQVQDMKKGIPEGGGSMVSVISIMFCYEVKSQM